MVDVSTPDTMSPGQAPVRPAPRQAAVLVARFLSELALLAVASTVGALTPGGLAVSIVLGIALPVLVALVWGRWIAPRAAGRLRDPSRLVVELVLFLGFGLVLALVGPVFVGGIFALLAANIAVLVRVVTPGA